MKITLKAYTHICSDECCFTTGYDVFVDGKQIGSTTDEDASSLAELLNKTFNTKDNGWNASMVMCDLCTHKWVAVRPENTNKLECPNCKNVGGFEDI